MNTKEELCRLVNSMECVQGFCWEREYDYVNDRIRPNLTFIFAPSVNYIGEKRLKVTFYDAFDFHVDEIFQMIAKPCIRIHNITGEQWENACYRIEEAEDYFSVKCSSFAYEWLEPEL